MNEFNQAKWVFFLVAAVFALYGLTTFLAATSCIFGFAAFTCPADGRLVDAFSSLLASALAFAAGRSTT